MAQHLGSDDESTMALAGISFRSVVDHKTAPLRPALYQVAVGYYNNQHEALPTAFLTGTSAGCSRYSASSGLTRSPGARRCSRIALISSSSSAYSSPRCARLSARARQHSLLCASKASKCVLAAASRPSRFVAADASAYQALRGGVTVFTSAIYTAHGDRATHP